MDINRSFPHEEGFRAMNLLGAEGRDFLFVISYDRSEIVLYDLHDLPQSLLFHIDGFEESSCEEPESHPPRLFISPPSFEEYLEAMRRVKEEIAAGNTYLLNLTFPTAVELEPGLSLRDIYNYARAPYKLYIEDRFVCFSPESFVRISQNLIRTYPMKGTIDASVECAYDKIVSNPKEIAEHTMIVDLMRNDLNMVGYDTKVEKFRYVHKIAAGERELLQVSSSIRSRLGSGWRARIGDIFRTLTPAGSISGTPKKSTLAIIEEIVGYERGFYTGVFGICSGERVESAVMIRYIEYENGNYIYKSGGGVTIESDPVSEYEELIAKIYIPF
jgi:para-aminobenzoate synthetase component 1